MNIEITDQDLKDLKVVRTYFGANDKTMFEHMAYDILDKIVKNSNVIQPVIGFPVEKMKEAYEDGQFDGRYENDKDFNIEDYR